MFRTGVAMSVSAIAAALAREDLSAGERLVAFSLASFADRENRAWPGALAAAARAGLSRSRYLQARDQLVRRGLVVVEDAATGRGRASTLGLRFGDEGPWCEGEINAPLFEASLAYSRARGPARLLLATMAALANEERVVEDLTTEQLCSAAGLADRTYRRARQALLASGELVLLSGVGGRGNANRWEISDPRLLAGEPGRPSASRRVPPPAGARPLVAPVAVGVSSTSHESPASFDLGPVPAARKGGQDQTLFGETPAERAVKTPVKTPAPIARAGKEPQNQRTKEHPPDPPQGGRSENSITIEQTYTTGRGRRRSRRVNVNLDEVRRTLGVPGPSDHADWERIRELLLEAVGESTFAIWLEPVELIAIDPDGALVLHAPPELRGWLQERFGRVVAQAAERAGRATRMADLAQSAAMGAR
jgi:DnaA N-terminal domain